MKLGVLVPFAILAPVVDPLLVVADTSVTLPLLRVLLDSTASLAALWLPEGTVVELCTVPSVLPAVLCGLCFSRRRSHWQ